MEDGWQNRNTRVLGGLILAVVAYGVPLRLLHTLTGKPLLDGIVGIVLGLDICAHQAAHAVNILFFERQALRQTPE